MFTEKIWGQLWMLVHEQGLVTLQNGFYIWVGYPLLPWIGVMATGYGLGYLFELSTAARRNALTLLGVAMLASFFVLRSTGLYGDPQAWLTHSAMWSTIGDYLDTRKYPPSLLYVLMTLGPVLIVLPWLERAKGFVIDIFATFGRVPLIFYVLHIYLAHGLMMIAGLAMGHSVASLIALYRPDTVGNIQWGFSLPVVYGVWLMVLMILYPACRQYEEIKRRRREWWLSYL